MYLLNRSSIALHWGVCIRNSPKATWALSQPTLHSGRNRSHNPQYNINIEGGNGNHIHLFVIMIIIVRPIGSNQYFPTRHAVHLCTLVTSRVFRPFISGIFTVRWLPQCGSLLTVKDKYYFDRNYRVCIGITTLKSLSWTHFSIIRRRAVCFVNVCYFITVSTGDADKL